MPRPRRVPVLAFEPAAPSPLRVDIYRFGAGRPPLDPGLHGHLFFEALYVEAGRGDHRVGAATGPAREGDLFLLAPGDVHDAAGLTRARGCLLLFGADALDPARSDGELLALRGEPLLLPFARAAGAPPPRLTVPRARRTAFAGRLAELERELRARDPNWQDAARSLLRLLLVEIGRLSPPSLARPAARATVVDALRFIDARFRQPIGPRDVARAVGRSPAHLTSQMRRETGRPLLAWIVERRMAEARRLLVETDRGLDDVAAAVGYDDVGYFIRRFRRLHGLSPAAWRRAHAG